MMRETRAVVRLNAISNNLDIAKRLAPASKIMAVIKANAYGHGALEVARKLEADVAAYAVAYFDEAVQLREAGIKRPILILQGTTADADVNEAAARDFWLMLHNRQQVERVLRSNTTQPVGAWVKVDTGMNRLGLTMAELDGVLVALSASDKVRSDLVLCSHLACSDDLDNPMTVEQLVKFRTQAAKYKLPCSIANSAAILSWPETHAEWNRPGYMLYGNSPLVSSRGDSYGLKPAMSMTSRIISVRQLKAGEGTGYGLNWVARKDSRLGIISIGYSDGYPRHAPNGTPVLVNGQRVPLAGRVSMDMLAVDVSGLETVEIGDPVELWGENLSIDEVALYAGTIGYEILAGLTGRIPMDYLP